MYKNLIVSGNFLIVIALAVLFMPSSAFCTSVLPDAVQAINSERIHTASNAAGPVLLASKETDKAEISPVDTKAPATTKDTDDADKEIVADPLEPVNRLMFGFNDKLYFWAMKPFFSVYNAALPEGIRIAGRNFFDNIAMPVRFVSCLVQIRIQCAGIEIARFGINSTIGMAGLFDTAASEKINLKPQDADMGLAMAHYGIGDGFYLVLPFLGPSSLRDGVGAVADGYLTPTSYLNPFYVPIAISAANYINRASLQVGEYEDLKNASIDPYVAIKDAYIQYRKGKIK